MIPVTGNDASQPSSPSRDLLLLTLVFGVLFFFLLGRTPLSNPDEGRYAEIPREMLVSGDWVTPRLNGVAYFEKPPLVYWAIAGSMTIFGANEWAIRTVPALAALAGVLLTYGSARRLFGRNAGLAAAMVLGSSLFYFVLTRIVLLDMVVSVLISATLFCFIVGIGEPAGARRRGLFYGLYAAAALATLAKGLIGFLLPGAVMFFWLLIFNQWRRLRPLYLPTGVLLFLAIAAPWHVLAAQRNPTWTHFYFVHEHWERFTTTTHGRIKPWWFFVPLVVFGLFPWIGFAWAALRRSLAGGWTRRHENAVAGFFVVWAVFVFLFFSKSQSKLAPYILPVFPPLAVLIGNWLAETSSAGLRRLRGGVMTFALAASALAVAVNLVTLKPSIARLTEAHAQSLRPLALSIGIVLVAGAALTIWLLRTGRPRSVLLSMGGTAALLYASLAAGTGRIESSSTRDLSRFVNETLPADARIFHYGDFFHDFPFYTGRFVGTVEFYGDELELENDPAARASGRFIHEAEFRQLWQNSSPLYVVVRKKKLADLKADYLREQSAATAPATTANARAIAKVPPVLLDPSCRSHILYESPSHLLLSNTPIIRMAELRGLPTEL